MLSFPQVNYVTNEWIDKQIPVSHKGAKIYGLRLFDEEGICHICLPQRCTKKGKFHTLLVLVHEVGHCLLDSTNIETIHSIYDKIDWYLFGRFGY
jgi:hypothetical protein